MADLLRLLTSMSSQVGDPAVLAGAAATVALLFAGVRLEALSRRRRPVSGGRK